MATYPLLTVPSQFQGPSGEEGQILIDGIVLKVSLYHGKVDDESDWHVDIDPDPVVWQVLGDHLRNNGVEAENQGVAVIRSELMVIDRHRNRLLNEFFDSADLSLPLRLSKRGSRHPAWDLGLIAGDKQGKNHNFSSNSKLYNDRGRVYLQGALVNDTAHGTKIEIHPLDSIAFAMNKSGKTLSAKWGQTGWPKKFVKWRVSFFTNSKFHRINKEDYLKRERTTTWYLDLPGDLGNKIKTNPLGLPSQVLGLNIQVESKELWDGGNEQVYFDRGVKSLSNWKLAVDPSDGRTKVKITAVMEIPDKFGGIMVLDYTLHWAPPVIARRQRL